MKPEKCCKNCIGISDNRINHILSVARQSYHLAKDKYHLSENDCRTAFLIGYLHDVGYEFAENKVDHPKISGELLSKQNLNSLIEPIATHGNPHLPIKSIMHQIINEADMTVDSNGELVTMEERLKDVENRLGADSIFYLDCVDMIDLLQQYKI